MVGLLAMAIGASNARGKGQPSRPWFPLKVIRDPAGEEHDHDHLGRLDTRTCP
jgi:hypothetical protein